MPPHPGWLAPVCCPAGVPCCGNTQGRTVSTQQGTTGGHCTALCANAALTLMLGAVWAARWRARRPCRPGSGERAVCAYGPGVLHVPAGLACCSVASWAGMLRGPITASGAGML